LRIYRRVALCIYSGVNGLRPNYPPPRRRVRNILLTQYKIIIVLHIRGTNDEKIIKFHKKKFDLGTTKGVKIKHFSFFLVQREKDRTETKQHIK